jgi:type I restriction enzyme, S subunit
VTLEGVSLGELMPTRDGTVDPSHHPTETFALYSIPAFDAGAPEILHGSEIGSSKQLVRPGDVLLSRIVPHIRRAWIVESSDGHRLIASGEWIVFRSSKLEPRYLRHYLTCDRFHSQFMRTVEGVGGSLLRARPTQVARIRTSLPSLAEQRRIADVLDKAEATRNKRQQAIDLAEELLRSAFFEIFGDPVANNKGWKVQPLGEVCDVAGGLQVTTARAGNPLSLPYLRVANVFRDRLNLSEVKNIRVTEAERDRATLRTGDVLVVEGHGNPAELGRAAVWSGEIQGCTHQNHLIRVRADTRIIRPIFLSAFLNSSCGRAQMLRLGKTTSGLNTISTKNVRSVHILVPPFGLQEAFERIVKKTRMLADRLTQARRFDGLLFTSLVQQAFERHCESGVDG